MNLYHDHPLASHPGRDETLLQVQKQYWWPGIKEWIMNYIKECAMCQQNKILMHQTKNPLYRIGTLPNACPFEQIAMDLITGLPHYEGMDAILTIVDQGCLRAAVFLPCSTTITGPQITQLYLDHIYQWFGLPTKMISNQDPQFTSHFGKALTKASFLSPLPPPLGQGLWLLPPPSPPLWLPLSLSIPLPQRRNSVFGPFVLAGTWTRAGSSLSWRRRSARHPPLQLPGWNSCPRGTRTSCRAPSSWFLPQRPSLSPRSRR